MRDRQGIVRTPRRPRDWVAPGPPPAVPRGRPEVWPGPGEDLCHLAGDWRILQRLDGHRWSLDDLVTAWVAVEGTRARAPARLVDLGCGIGTVLLLLAWAFPGARCLGVEAETVGVALARRSIAWNGIGARCEIRCGDLRDPAILAGAKGCDLVTATPPYLPVGTATAPANRQRCHCRLEERGGIEDYTAAAGRVLGLQGLFVTCAGADQHRRVAAAAAGADLAIARCVDVVPRAGKATLFRVYALCRPANERAAGDAPAGPQPAGGREAGSRGARAALAESPLVVRDRDGQWTAAFRAVRRAMGMPA